MSAKCVSGQAMRLWSKLDLLQPVSYYYYFRELLLLP